MPKTPPPNRGAMYGAAPKVKVKPLAMAAKEAAVKAKYAAGKPAAKAPAGLVALAKSRAKAPMVAKKAAVKNTKSVKPY